ncbi:MAG: metallopeptidase family protein [Candidatus Kerfeldbacteria bacterium]|nr:metallopeptidase family protein [Candidatus Kerfeldbacteria bacterium]
MERDEFEQLVAEGLSRIPDKFRKLLKNVAVVIEDFPSTAQLRKTGVRRGSLLLGLYEGVPRIARYGHDPLLPDKITIFQRSIEMVAHSPEAIRQAVAEKVWHEVGHHFGLSEHAVRQAQSRKFKHR